MQDPKKKMPYLPDPKLQDAVEMAISMEIPLFVTGEPGTGKTELAYWIAQHEPFLKQYGLGGEVLRFNVKTTSTAKDLLYRYDAIRHFRESHRLQHETGGAQKNLNILQFIQFEALGQAIIAARSQRRVVLIDEIDKAPRDFPNDLLFEFEKLAFRIEEATTPELHDAKFDWPAMPSLRDLGIDKPVFNEQDFILYADKAEIKEKKVRKPVLILTSNSEKNLPDAFLRRCAFYHIPFPEDHKDLQRILEIKGLYDEKKNAALLASALDFFLDLRKNAGLRRKPATAELIVWVEFLLESKLDPHKPLEQSDVPALLASLSMLGKNREDLDRIRQQLETKRKNPPASAGIQLE